MANKIKHKTPEAKALAIEKTIKKYKSKRSQIFCYIEDRELIENYAKTHDLTLMEALHILLQENKND
jgi:hypothetical protein